MRALGRAPYEPAAIYRYLVPREQQVLTLRQHWAFLIPPAAAAAGAALAAGVVTVVAPGAATLATVAADRAVHLSDDLLAFGRRNPPEPEPTDLNALITGAGELLRIAAGGKVTLCLALSPVSLPDVLADPRQLEQVLLNLTLNARDAMPDGGTVTIGTSIAELDERRARLHPGTSPGRYLKLTVTDTGAGMSDEIAARIFDRFFTTKPGTGTGLGLATVQTVVADACGSIEVDTEPGSGTTFSIYLPVIARRPAPEARVAGRQPADDHDEA